MIEEISERLTRELKNRVPSLFDQLQPALALANEQLEFLSPLMMSTRIVDIVAYVNKGTWLIVLANPKKVFTMHMLAPPAPHTRREIFDGCTDAAIKYLGHVPTEKEVIGAIDMTVEQHGGPPGAKTPSIDQQVGSQIFGLLWAAYPDRADLIDGVEKTINANICPLHVGLVGVGRKQDTKCGVWPLGLPFATYIEG